MDWFRCSSYIQATAKAIVARQIDEHLAGVVALAASSDISATNLYLSGSLVRGEPSVVIDDDRPRLFSDVDLVAVTALPAEEHDRVRDLAEHANAREPAIETTVFVVAAANLHAVRSMFGRDLVSGLDDPILDSVSIVAPELPALGITERMENLVHQVGGVVYFDESGLLAGTGRHFRPTLAYHEHKLALDCLRCSTPTPEGEPARFSDALAWDPHPSGLHRDVVAELVASREVFTPGLPRSLDLATLVVGAITSILAGSHGSSVMDAVELVVDRYQGTTDVMNGYQLATLLVYLLPLVPVIDRASALDLLARTWHEMERDELVGAQDAVEQLANLDRSLIAEDGGLFAGALPLLREVRLDYYHHLGPHNFGARAFPSYGAAERAQ